MALAPGDRLGPYEILALLGVGGMGEVYRGRDTRLGRDVALKVISPRLVHDPALRHRFEREARAASALNHPAIVTIFDVGETGGASWIAMEWVEGRTLRQTLAAGPLPVGDAVSIARQVAEGLAAAHAKGIVHRDLKPENVMVGAEGRVKILDFGLARHGSLDATDQPLARVDEVATVVNTATLAGTILGTAGYMSPEQASGQLVDFRSDQFSWGLLLYEMLAGRQAFARATTVETLWAVIREEPTPLVTLRSDVPEAVLDVVARCLAKQPGDRFESTRDLVEALDGGITETTSVGPHTRQGPGRAAAVAAGPAGVPRARRRLSVALAAIAGTVIAAAGLAGWLLRPPSKAAITSLAVLPFENRSVGDNADYLGDELAESLIEQMSRLPTLTVMARATTFTLKGSRDPRAAGRQLRVGAVVTGTVSRRGDELLIAAELIDVATGARLWGERYQRPVAELMAVQDTIAAEVAQGLRLKLTPEAKRTLGGQGTTDPEAYELVLKARYLLTTATEADDLEARRLYEQAIARDPSYVDAHIGLAATYARSAGSGYVPPDEAWPRVDDALRRVLALDPANVRARAMRASMRLQRDWDWATAEREFTQLSQDSRLFLGNQYHPVALYFWARGRPDESVALLERALRLDPGNLESRVMMADFLMEAGRLDDAVRYYRAILAVTPAEPRSLFGLAEALRRRGHLAEAIETLRKAYEAVGEDVGLRALTGIRTEEGYAKAEVAVARARLERELARADELQYVSPLDLARLYAQVGDRERAFSSLEEALAERSPMLILLKVDRAWDQLRADSRFVAAVRRVRIP